MGVIKLSGLVINETKKGEADKVLTLFTLEEGKAYVYSKGARKLSSRFFSGSALFDYSDFVVYSGRDFYSSTQIDKITAYGELGLDYEKLCCANLFLELVDKTTFVGEPNPPVLKLLLSALTALLKGLSDSFCVYQAFLFKYLQICGYEPLILNCAYCGCGLDAKGDVYYCISGAICKTCSLNDATAVKVNDTALYAIEYILSSEISEAFSYKIDERSRAYLKRASDISLANFDVILKGRKFVDEIYDN